MDLRRLGTHYGGRWVELSKLNESSIVYSAGTGEDASFDLELIKLKNCVVHAFDPTPRSIEWVKRQLMPAQFVFHGVGLASFDGTTWFYPPKDPTWVSHSIVQLIDGVGRPPIVVSMKRLNTVMKELTHTRIDLLKLDIEGAEYEVLDTIELLHIPVSQICVEFHDVGGIDIRGEVEKVCRMGYQLVKNEGEEYTFLVLKG